MINENTLLELNQTANCYPLNRISKAIISRLFLKPNSPPPPWVWSTLKHSAISLWIFPNTLPQLFSTLHKYIYFQNPESNCGGKGQHLKQHQVHDAGAALESILGGELELAQNVVRGVPRAERLQDTEYTLVSVEWPQLDWWTHPITLTSLTRSHFTWQVDCGRQWFKRNDSKSL